MSEANGNGAVLDRAAFCARYVHWQPRVEEVTLPDGAKCFVREMDGASLDDWQSGNLQLDKATGEVVFRGNNQRGRLVAKTLCSPTAERLFRDEEAVMIGGWPGPVLDAIYQAARKLNKLNADPEADAKNSSKSRTASSGGGSPEASTAPSPSASPA